MLIVPPKAHVSVHVLLSAGTAPSRGNVAPTQTPAGVGTHGTGVNTPGGGAAVAAATAGFPIDVHIPHGATLAIGAASWIVAAGFPPIRMVGEDVAVSVPGAVPIVHIYVAPITAGIAINSPPTDFYTCE